MTRLLNFLKLEESENLQRITQRTLCNKTDFLSLLTLEISLQIISTTRIFLSNLCPSRTFQRFTTGKLSLLLISKFSKELLRQIEFFFLFENMRLRVLCKIWHYLLLSIISHIHCCEFLVSAIAPLIG